MSTSLNIALVISAALSGSVQSVLGGVQKTLVKLGDTTKELTDRQKRLGSVIKDLSLNSPHLSSMQHRYREIGTAIDLVSSKQKRLNALIRQGAAINQARDGYKSSMFETAGQAVAVGAPVYKSVRLAGDFQDQLRDISITGEFSKKEEAVLGATLRENALRFNQTQEDLSKGIGVLVAGGISSSKELAAFAPVLAKAATATRASVEDLGSVFLAMRDNLKISAKDSESALNMLAYAGKKGQFELKDMAAWLPRLAPQMAALGLTGKEAVAEIGSALQIARKGAGSNDEAGNNFRNFLAKVTSPDSIKDFAKAGIDLKGDLVKLRAEGLTPMQGMLQLITQYMGTKGPEAAGEFTKALSIKDAAEREAAISRLQEAYKLGELFQDMQAMNFIKPAIANAKEMASIKQGALDAGGTDLLGADLAKRMEGFNERWKGFSIQLKELGISLGNALLPPLSAALSMLLPVVGLVGKLVTTFPRLSGALVLVVSGLLAGKMAMLGFLYLKSMISGFFLSVQIASASASAKLAIFRVQTLLAGGAMRTLNLSMLANPLILAATAAVLALGAAVYQLKKHWSTLKQPGFLKDLAGWIGSLPRAMFTAGVNIITSLFEGMKKAFNKPVELMKGLATRLRGFLPFSPAKEGPLKDIHRVRLIETIAESMRPTPMIKAMRTATAATMVAASASFAMPAGVAAPQQRTATATAAAQQAATHITFAPVINLAAGAPDEVRHQVDQALKLSQSEFEKMLRRAKQNEARKGFV